jgi:hypothetical protein
VAPATAGVFVAGLLFAACAGPAPAPPPSPPPPPPRTDVAAMRVSGVVLGSDGHLVTGAAVVAGAGTECELPANAIGAISDESGRFSLTIEGIAAVQCVVVEARAGGAAGSATTYATFAIPPGAVELTVRLSRPSPLTAAEAARLVRLLAAAINDPSAPVDELSLYAARGAEALRVAIEMHRQILGRVADVREVASSVPPSVSYQHFTFELRGESGRVLHTDVHQEALTRVHSLLLDYGWRTERFINAYVRAIASGDAERLSRILNPDDIDFPVERAREMILDYRRRYRDTATIRQEFVSVDEERHRITWRLRGIGPDGSEVTEEIVLQTGDSLVGVVGL